MLLCCLADALPKCSAAALVHHLTRLLIFLLAPLGRRPHFQPSQAMTAPQSRSLLPPPHVSPEPCPLPSTRSGRARQPSPPPPPSPGGGVKRNGETQRPPSRTPPSSPSPPLLRLRLCRGLRVAPPGPAEPGAAPPPSSPPPHPPLRCSGRSLGATP